MKSANRNSFLFLMMVLLSIHCSAQEYPRKEIDFNEIADELYGFQDLDLNYEELYENLVQLLSKPVDLNKVNEEDLRFLKILSEHQLNNLITYRNTNGNFLSVYELQAVPGFDLNTLYKLVPFVKVSDPSSTLNSKSWRRVVNESDNYFLLRYERTLQQKQGFKEDTNPSQK